MRYIHHLYVTSLALSNTLSLCVWKCNLRAKVASNDFGNVSQRFMFSGALLPLASFFAGFINGSIQRSCTVTSIQANFFSLADQLHHVLLCSYKIDVYFVFTLQTKPTGNLGVCKQVWCEVLSCVFCSRKKREIAFIFNDQVHKKLIKRINFNLLFLN